MSSRNPVAGFLFAVIAIAIFAVTSAFAEKTPPRGGIEPPKCGNRYFGASPFDHVNPAFGTASGNQLYFYTSPTSMVVFGYAGGDAIAGGACADALFGGSGGDFVDGHGGNDIILGNDGGDILFGGSGDDIIVEGSEGGSNYGEEGNDIIVGGNDSGAYFAGDGDDIVRAGNGNDGVNGGEGDDILLGGIGDDGLNGGPGSDVLIAGPVDKSGDQLIGAEGNDVLISGPGWTRFTFGPGSGEDVVIGFNPADNDEIDLMNFNLTAADFLMIDNVAGDTLIEGPNGEKIRVIGVSVAALTNSILY